MLFCITADYTPQAFIVMRNDPNADRREIVQQVLEAAGSKLIAMYGRVENGPGVLIIFEADDPKMVPQSQMSSRRLAPRRTSTCSAL